MSPSGRANYSWKLIFQTLIFGSTELSARSADTRSSKIILCYFVFACLGLASAMKLRKNQFKYTGTVPSSELLSCAAGDSTKTLQPSTDLGMVDQCPGRRSLFLLGVWTKAPDRQETWILSDWWFSFLPSPPRISELSRTFRLFRLRTTENSWRISAKINWNWRKQNYKVLSFPMKHSEGVPFVEVAMLRRQTSGWTLRMTPWHLSERGRVLSAVPPPDGDTLFTKMHVFVP